MRLKLPAFKVTQRCGGVVNHSTVSRGSIAGQSVPVREEISDDSQSDGEWDEPGMWQDSECSPPITMEDFCTTSDPSLHEIKQIASILAWEKLRPKLLHTAVENSALPCKQPCLLCGEDEAVYRCVQCAPWVHYCHSCFRKAHSNINIFHVGEIWDSEVSEVYCYNNIFVISCTAVAIHKEYWHLT